MTGKRYYLTTLRDWQRHAGRFANSHYVVLSVPENSSAGDAAADSAATPILALVEADEGAHLALEDDTAFEALPHALAPQAISDRAQAALAPLGVASGATTFDAAEILARLHPLLRHRVF